MSSSLSYSFKVGLPQMISNGFHRFPYLFFFLFLFSKNAAWAQFDSTYVVTTTHTKNIGLYTTSRDFVLSFQAPDSREVFFQNANLGLGVQVAFKKLGISMALPLVQFRSEAFGQPQNLQFNVNLYPASFYFYGDFRYIRMSGEKIFGKNLIANFLDPKGRALYATLRSHYFFNASQFSLSAALQMTNRQIRSAGSAFLYLPLGYQLFLQEDEPNNYPEQWLLTNHQGIKFGLGSGYAYSRVRGHWTATGLIGGGIIYQSIKYQVEKNPQFFQRGYFQPELNLMGAIVYNKEHFFYGIKADYFHNFTRKILFGPHIRTWSTKLTVGWRFD